MNNLNFNLSDNNQTGDDILDYIENYDYYDEEEDLYQVIHEKGNNTTNTTNTVDIDTPNPDFEENFDVFDYYSLYSSLFFEDRLGPVRLEWSKKMTLCAGIFSVRNNEPIIRLSEPLLKFRGVNEIKETLLHEMIHAWAYIEDLDQSDDRTGHGVHFKMKMHEINKNTVLNITVFHSFHDEVDFHRKHIWRCNGKCQNEKPYYEWVKRAMNKPPGKYDRWWNDHQVKCGGQFIKIIEEEVNNNKEKDNKDLKDDKKDKDKKKKNNKINKEESSKNNTLDNFVISNKRK